MRVVLDACVIYPPVLRRILLGVAARGLFAPLWSDRILEEWARAAVKLGPEAVMEARAQGKRMRAEFPAALVPAAEGLERRLSLPDPNDVHVLATAITGSADAILTFNATDFPRHLLAEEGVERRDPDGFLWLMWSHNPEVVSEVVASVHALSERMAGEARSLKAALKRSQLPRLAKALQPETNGSQADPKAPQA